MNSLKFIYVIVEVSIKSPTQIVVTDNSNTTDKLIHRPLAPLASSETFSDVSSIYRDETLNKDSLTNKQLQNTIKNSDFDSLEILFDFPSVDISNESQTKLETRTESSCRIRFSENTQIINSPRVT